MESICRVFVAIVVTMGHLSFMACVSQADEATPTSVEQKANADRLRQKSINDRNELWNQAHKLRTSGELANAIAIGQRITAMELEVGGERSANLKWQREFIAECAEEAEDWKTAEESREANIQLAIALYGENDYRTTYARYSAKHTQRLNELTSEQRKSLFDATNELKKIDSLLNQDKSAEATTIAREIVDRSAELLGNDDAMSASAKNKLGVCLKAQKEFQPAIDKFAEAEKVYAIIGDPIASVNQCAWRGECYRDAQNDEAALKVYQEYTERSVQLNYRVGIAWGWPRTGKALFRLKRFQDGLVAFENAGPVLIETGDPVESIWMRFWHGRCYLEMNDLESAAKDFRECLDRFRTINNDAGIAENQFYLGKALYELRRYEQALDQFRDADTVYQKLENKTDAAWSQYWHGRCFLGLNDIESAARDFRENIDRFCAIQNDVGIATNQNFLARTLYENRQFGQALAQFREAQNLYRKSGYTIDVVWMQDWQAACFRELKDDQSAISDWTECVKQFAELKYDQGLVQISDKLARYLYGLNRYAEALSEFSRAEATYQKLGNPKATAMMAGWVGNCHRELGQFDLAEQSYRRELNLLESLTEIGPDHLDTAGPLTNLGQLLRRQAKFALAVPFFHRVLKINQTHRSQDSLEVAQALNHLGILEYEQGNYEQAEVFCRQSLQIVDSRFGVDHENSAEILNNLAVIEHVRGNYASAESLYRRSLRIQEMQSSPNQAAIANGLNNLAAFYYKTENYEAALPLFQRAIKIQEAHLGNQDLDTARSLNNLGMLFYEQGNYVAAEPLLQQTLKIRESKNGPDHPETALCLNNLATLYCSEGNYEAAVPLLQRALEIREKQRGATHLETALSLTNLAVAYDELNKYPEAARLYERALKINESTLGVNHLDNAVTISRYSQHFSRQGNYAEGMSLCRRALAIRENKLGADAAVTADSLSMLAALSFYIGDYAQAETLYLRTLNIRETKLGPDHPNTTKTRSNIAIVHWRNGDQVSAHPLALRAINNSLRHVERMSAILSEQQQVHMVANEQLSRSAWLTVSSKNVSADVTWRAILPWKGLVTANQIHMRRERASDPLWGEYRRVTQRLSSLSLAPPLPPNDPTELVEWNAKEPELRRRWQKQKDELATAHEQMEKELAAKSAAFRTKQTRQAVTPAAIAETLARVTKPTALVDLVAYEYFGQSGEQSEERLTAFVIRKDRPVVRVNLGNLDSIKDLVGKWRKWMGAGPEGRSSGQTLRERLWKPLEPFLVGIETVLISPDGAISQLPWGALPGAKAGTYLLEEWEFGIIPIPQSLPEFVSETPNKGPPASLLLAGDIDYGSDSGSSQEMVTAREIVIRDRHEGRSLQFAKLAAAQPEMASIKERYERAMKRLKRKGIVESLYEGDATENEFCTQAEKFPWLHLVTHGYFAPEAIKSVLQSSGSPRSIVPENQQLGASIHPGLLSGLAFAGANRQPEHGKDDGILSALDVSSLDLSRVDTVVLSACETGLGEVAGGEGLLGLQRSFQVSGAKTCIASLWKVSDAATAKLMQRFYENLWDKQMGKLEALREAQVWMMRDSGARALIPVDEQTVANEAVPPQFWAAFVLSGDWR